MRANVIDYMQWDEGRWRYREGRSGADRPINLAVYRSELRACQSHLLVQLLSQAPPPANDIPARCMAQYRSASIRSLLTYLLT